METKGERREPFKKPGSPTPPPGPLPFEPREHPDQYVSTSYVERQNLSLRMGQRRFTRLTNGFSKNLDNHIAAVALYVAHYNLCRNHEALRTTPAKALGVADKAWSIGQLVDAALAVAPALPTETPPDRRRKFTVIQGGLE